MDGNSGFDVVTPTVFQQTVMAGLAQLFRKQGAAAPVAFRFRTDGAGYYETSVAMPSGEYVFEVYKYAAYLQRGPERYESGAFYYGDERRDANDFVERVGRLLIGQRWFASSDPGPFDSVIRLIRRVFRRDGV